MRVKIPAWLYVPNLSPGGGIMALIVLIECAAFLLYWTSGANPLLPTPMEIIDAFPHLMKVGLMYHLMTSMKLFLQALGIATLFSLAFAYLSRFALIFPVASVVGKMRFLGQTGMVFLFTMIFGGGYNLRLSLLVFAITVFYTIGMVAEVKDIRVERYDHARTLKMGEWHVLYEVVILGTLVRAIELMRQNAAIGWMMLTVVEGLSRVSGGVGVLLLNADKVFGLADVFALQFVFFVVGVCLDYGFGRLKDLPPAIVRQMGW